MLKTKSYLQNGRNATTLVVDKPLNKFINLIGHVEEALNLICLVKWSDIAGLKCYKTIVRVQKLYRLACIEVTNLEDELVNLSHRMTQITYVFDKLFDVIIIKRGSIMCLNYTGTYVYEWILHWPRSIYGLLFKH